jgi:hypothetical protein
MRAHSRVLSLVEETKACPVLKVRPPLGQEMVQGNRGSFTPREQKRRLCFGGIVRFSPVLVRGLAAGAEAWAVAKAGRSRSAIRRNRTVAVVDRDMMRSPLK